MSTSRPFSGAGAACRAQKPGTTGGHPAHPELGRPGGRTARRSGAVVTVAGTFTPPDPAGAGRELSLSAAERLIAEHGVRAVPARSFPSLRTRTGLVRAIVREHAHRIEPLRLRMLAGLGGATDPRDWVACLVRPATEHLAGLGTPSWYARFTAEATADPTLRAAVIDETLTAPSLQKALGGLNEVLAALPLRVRMERGDMARHLITQVCAERERALADGTPTSRPTWEETATGLVDAIAGLLLAPVTPTG